jgi:hypothetical protein
MKRKTKSTFYQKTSNSESKSASQRPAFILKEEPGVVVHACNLSTQETEAGSRIAWATL